MDWAKKFRLVWVASMSLEETRNPNLKLGARISNSESRAQYDRKKARLTNSNVMKIDEAKIAVYKIQGLPMSEKKTHIRKKMCIEFFKSLQN